MEERIARGRRMMNKGERIKWQRRRIWEVNPRCHWCQCVTILPDYHARMGRPNPKWATIEHLDARHSKERGKHPREFRHVLACWKCNNDRDRRELKALPIQSLWEMNGHFYQIAKATGALNEIVRSSSKGGFDQ